MSDMRRRRGGEGGGRRPPIVVVRSRRSHRHPRMTTAQDLRGPRSPPHPARTTWSLLPHRERAASRIFGATARPRKKSRPRTPPPPLDAFAEPRRVSRARARARGRGRPKKRRVGYYTRAGGGGTRRRPPTPPPPRIERRGSRAGRAFEHLLDTVAQEQRRGERTGRTDGGGAKLQGRGWAAIRKTF